MNFLKVAWRDIRSIFKNRFIRVSVIAIIIVPLLYSLLYLDAFWDPYTRIKDMPVAVVNGDKGSVKDGENVNYGQDLVDNLKDKESVGWRFVTKKQAEEGVKGKDYYAMFVIPENFSENVLSSTKGKPQQAKILYSANEKRNFLAAQINGKVLDQIKSELTKSMSKEYTTSVFDSLYEIKDGMKKASDGSKELADGLVTAKAGSGKLKDGAGQLNSSVPEMIDGVGKLLVGSNTLTSKLGELNDQVPTMVSGVNKLYSGAGQLNNGLSELNSQVPNMAAGVKKLNESYKTQIIPSTGKLKDGANPLMMFFVITDKVDGDIEASPAAVVAGKFLSYGAIGFMQAVLASAAVMLLGLRPNNILLYFLFNIFLSYVFIAIIQCMVFLLGQVGRLLSIILLILQLTSCAGTFPIEVVPKLFRVLNPFMPFTYAVSGLREVVSGVDYGVFAKDVTILSVMLFVFLFTSILMKGHADKIQILVQERKEQAANVQ